MDTLTKRAFRTVPAREANDAMARLREERGGALGQALNYEGVIPEGADLAQLAEKFLPRLIYFLDCRGAPLPRAPGVFISLFQGENLHFFEVHDVIEVLGQAWGLDTEALVKRFGAAATDQTP